MGKIMNTCKFKIKEPGRPKTGDNKSKEEVNNNIYFNMFTSLSIISNK